MREHVHVVLVCCIDARLTFVFVLVRGLAYLPETQEG